MTTTATLSGRSTTDAILVTVPAPVVAYMAPSDSVARIFAGIAWKIRNHFDLGGSNVTAALARFLADVDEALTVEASRQPYLPMGVDTITVRAPQGPLRPDMASFLTERKSDGRVKVNRSYQRYLLELLDSAVASLEVDGGYWVESERAQLRIGDRVRAYVGDFERYEETVVLSIGHRGLAALPRREAIASIRAPDGVPDFTGWRFERLAFPGEAPVGL